MSTPGLPPGILGRHMLADFHGVEPALLIDAPSIEALLTRAALRAGATPLFGKFHQFGEGQGITGVMLLQESHISIHTWPEYGFAAVDVFMCGTAQPELAIALLRDALAPERVQIHESPRGSRQATWDVALGDRSIVA